MEVITEQTSVRDKQDFLARYKPLLAKVVEYECTGVMDRAGELFNKYAGMQHVKAKYGQEPPQEFLELKESNPEEWRAWQTHHIYFKLGRSAAEQGLVTLDELIHMKEVAQQEYRETRLKGQMVFQ